MPANTFVHPPIPYVLSDLPVHSVNTLPYSRPINANYTNSFFLVVIAHSRRATEVSFASFNHFWNNTVVLCFCSSSLDHTSFHNFGMSFLIFCYFFTFMWFMLPRFIVQRHCAWRWPSHWNLFSIQALDSFHIFTLQFFCQNSFIGNI